MDVFDGRPLQFLARLRHERSERRYRMSKTDRGWFQLREHTSYHTDTVADRIFP